jgi:hypothetical protein
MHWSGAVHDQGDAAPAESGALRLHPRTIEGTKEVGDVSKRGGNKSKRPQKPPMANKGPKEK